MCIIVDTCVVSTVLVHTTDQFVPVFAAISVGRHKLVCGGRLYREFSKMTELMGILREFDRGGRLRLVPSSEVDAAERVVVARGSCQSDDHHVIALAQVSSARLLCSTDDALIADFTNKGLLAPKGKVYKDLKTRHLVDRSCLRCKPT